MKHMPIIIGLLTFLTSCASLSHSRAPASAAAPDSRELALNRFREFATRQAITFGEPKGSEVTFDASKDHFELFIGKRSVGNAELFERCAANLPDSGELLLRCFYGVNGKVGKQEVAVDPQLNTDGFPIPTIGNIALEPHFQGLNSYFKNIPAARQALAGAMTLNGCHKLDLQDSSGTVAWIVQAALADEDSGKLDAGAERTWRGSLPCRDNKFPVYFDVTQRAGEKEVQVFITPVKATTTAPVFIKAESPDL
jgi:hypothetical protein